MKATGMDENKDAGKKGGGITKKEDANLKQKQVKRLLPAKTSSRSI